MRNFIAIAALATISGCAIAPGDVGAQGNRYAGIFRQSASGSAECLVRNTEVSGLGLTATILNAGADREVIVRPENSPSTTIAIWRIREQGTAGSTYVVDFMQRVRDREELIRRMLGDSIASAAAA